VWLIGLSIEAKAPLRPVCSEQGGQLYGICKCVPLCLAVLSALSNSCCLFGVFQTNYNDDDDITYTLDLDFQSHVSYRHDPYTSKTSRSKAS